jgi:hypothetical protein
MNGKQLAGYQWGNPTRYIYSHKNKKHIWLNGGFEAQVALSFEFDDNIQRYKSQPVSIAYHDKKNQLCRYTFDFLTESYAIRKPFNFHEAKQKRFSETQKALELFRNVRNHLSKTVKIPFVVTTEEDIAQGQLLTNYKRIYHYKRIPAQSYVSKSQLSKWMGKTFNLDDFRGCLRSKGFAEPVSFSFLAHQLVRGDLSKPSSDEMLLEIA